MFNDDNDEYDSDVVLRGDISLYRASTPFADIIRDKESKEACKNRLREYFIKAYNETFINVYLTGKAAVRKLIVILGVQEALTAICADPHALLRKIVKPWPLSFTRMTLKRLELPRKNTLSQLLTSRSFSQSKM